MFIEKSGKWLNGSGKCVGDTICHFSNPLAENQSKATDPTLRLAPPKRSLVHPRSKWHNFRRHLISRHVENVVPCHPPLILLTVSSPPFFRAALANYQQTSTIEQLQQGDGA